jgi:tetratricopeptide (TPR) repeat protein
MKQLSNASLLLVCLLLSCNGKKAGPPQALIDQMNLKRGSVISCSPAGEKYGQVNFDMSCDEKVKNDFNLAIELLHSFEYDEAEKVFAKVIDQSPGCAMAYWGVAMCNFHPLWSPPTQPELIKGSKAIAIANSIGKLPARESAYINAIGAYYNNWDKTLHRNRCLNFEKAMEQLQLNYPADKEAAIFYALALDAAAEPTDKTFARQKKAGAILTTLYPAQPGHPGIVHYIIHTYDYPGLAQSGLDAARKYASVAPSSAHALHMPSHIFTRLGLWDECISSNTAAVTAAKCYGEAAGTKGNWSEELHGLDYLVYAYLQKGDNVMAKKYVDYLNAINSVDPPDFKAAYAFASSPCRLVLENKDWQQAATIPMHGANIAWTKFPWQEAIIHFARCLGATHIKNIAVANAELVKLQQLHDTLQLQKDAYRAGLVAVQINTAKAWIALATAQPAIAVNLMKLAADMEDSTEKSPVSPGEILPARELLGDMFFQLGQYQNALAAYEVALKKSPNRFNSLYGAGMAAQKMNNSNEALSYYQQLLRITDAKSTRRELESSRSYLNKAVILNVPAE